MKYFHRALASLALALALAPSAAHSQQEIVFVGSGKKNIESFRFDAGTGAMKHGILGNNRFDTASWVYRADNPDNYDAQPPYRDHSDIKAATLWSVARAKGLKTAAIGWPQTAGGPIDYRLDIVMAGTGPESHQRTVRAAATAAGPERRAVQFGE